MILSTYPRFETEAQGLLACECSCLSSKEREETAVFRRMEGNADSRIREKFASGNRNPGLWNPEYISRIP